MADMDDDELDELERKCTEIVDLILDKKINNDEELESIIKKLLSKKEIMRVAMHSMVREALDTALYNEKDELMKEVEEAKKHNNRSSIDNMYV